MSEPTPHYDEQPTEVVHSHAAKQSHFWWYYERLICARPVHHQDHAACVRTKDHSPDVPCDGYYEPTEQERIAAWQGAPDA